MRKSTWLGAAAALAATFLIAGSLGPVDIDQAKADPKTLAIQGLAALERSRANADPTELLEAESLLEASLDLDGTGNFEAEVGMASLSNARHDFSGSLKWARAAIKTNPHNASPYGLLGDALFELGRYRAADAAYQKMVDIRPDYASYVRASYAQQFHGDTPSAIVSMSLALKSAGPTGETAAWIRHQLGDIYFGLGDLEEAARQNRIGTKVAPGYVPPTVGLAEVAIKRGNLARATALVERAAAELPTLEYLIKLGDLYDASGEADKAKRQYRLVAEKLALYRSSGVLPDVDFILFYADHSLRPRATLREARFIYRNRPTGAAADALGWTLFKQGHPRAAWRYSREALGSSLVDPSMRSHARAIARALAKDRVST
jgi:tetratricopeptide (TPR) repeat protein